jgi:hypothetical protein
MTTWDIHHLRSINILVNLAMNSAKIKKLIIHEPNKDFEMRSQIHVFFQAPIGNCKSTVLNMIANSVSQPVWATITRPGLVGSMDPKTFQATVPAAWTARNSLLILDEFCGWGNEFMNALLQLMEGQEYSRKIGIWGKAGDEDGDLFWAIGEGEFKLKTRFSAIIATMRNFESSTRMDMQALMTRCLPYKFALSPEIMKRILCGDNMIEIIPASVRSEVEIGQEDYMQIVEVVELHVLDKKYPLEVFMRGVGDCCRIFAVNQVHDNEFYRSVIDLKARFFQAQQTARDVQRDSYNASTQFGKQTWRRS